MNDDEAIYDYNGNVIAWGTSSSKSVITSPAAGNITIRNNPNTISNTVIEYACTCRYCNDIVFKREGAFGKSSTVKRHVAITSYDNLDDFRPSLSNGGINKVYICWDCFKNMAPDDIITDLEVKNEAP